MVFLKLLLLRQGLLFLYLSGEMVLERRIFGVLLIVKMEYERMF